MLRVPRMADPGASRTLGAEIGLALRILLATAALLLAASLFQGLTRWELGYYTRLLDVDFEAGAYTWLSSCLIFLTALAVLHVAWLRRELNARDWRAWGVLGAVLLGLSSEEILAIHERFAWRAMPSVDPRIVWSAPALVLCLAGLFAATGFLRSLPRSTRRAFLVAGAVYVGGAAGVELVEGLLITFKVVGDAPLLMLLHVEEGTEFLGMFLMLRAVLIYCRTEARAPLPAKVEA